MKPQTSFEHEFLIRLAPIWMACRWRIMGHPLSGCWPKPDLAFDLLGMCDYSAEMRLACHEAIRGLVINDIKKDTEVLKDNEVPTLQLEDPRQAGGIGRRSYGERQASDVHGRTRPESQAYALPRMRRADAVVQGSNGALPEEARAGCLIVATITYLRKQQKFFLT